MATATNSDLNLWLSPSRAGDFKRCPQLFKYRSIEKLPEPPSEAALRGTVVHTVLERLFDLPASKRSPDGGLGLVADAIQASRSEVAELAEVVGETEAAVARRLEADSGPLVENYFALEDPRTIEPVGREIRLRGVVDGTQMVGVIDRLDVTPEGDFVISDYKTGGSPSDRFAMEAFFGLRIYALLLKTADWIAKPPTSVRLLYLSAREVLEIDIDEPRLRGTSRQVSAIRLAIEHAHEADDFRARPSGLCNYCHFRASCPAFDGQAEVAAAPSATGAKAT